jgi:hypothetical protein
MSKSKSNRQRAARALQSANPHLTYQQALAAVLTAETTPTPPAVSTTAISADGQVRVEWDYLGEGLSGDYDEDNPDDEALMRYSAYILATPENTARHDLETVDPSDKWGTRQDGSYCTNTPYDTDPQTLRALAQMIADRLADAATNGTWKRTAEEMSYAHPDWVTAPAATASAPLPSTLPKVTDLYECPICRNRYNSVEALDVDTHNCTGLDDVDGIDDNGPFSVGDTLWVQPGQQARRFARFTTEAAAADFIASLPDADTGRYYLDGPADDAVDSDYEPFTTVTVVYDQSTATIEVETAAAISDLDGTIALALAANGFPTQYQDLAVDGEPAEDYFTR